MEVHVLVLDPQGSMGGFEWNESLDVLEQWERDHREVPTLGYTTVEVDSRQSAEDCTRQIDEQLPELERQLRLWLIVEGNPVTGFHFYGPLDNHEEAFAYAQRACDEEWWVAPVWKINFPLPS